MLKRKIPKRDVQSLSQDADAILRSLQNQKMPLIDIFVRESLQNSLDAYLNKDLNVKVNFFTGSFDGKCFAKHLESLESRLPKGPADFLAIRDEYTLGLTGPYLGSKEKLDKSHFHKLVFNIGKRQISKYAGGSWGLGKTSYFHLGVGIVLYYTRTSDTNKERLIVSLIEDQDSQNQLLPESDRGIAWWGEFVDKEGILHPVTDPIKISEILNIFNISQYESGESGTTVIIPYMKPTNELYNNSKNRLPWEFTLQDSISMAIARWYSPRILNTDYKKINELPALEIFVDTKKFDFSSTPPVFLYFRRLYTSALQGKNDLERDIFVKEIKLTRKKITVGNIAYKVVSREELQMLPPDNFSSPLLFTTFNSKEIDNPDRSGGNVIFAYSRKPGMVLEYLVDTSDWVKKEIKLDEGDYLFAFFVPCPQAKIEDLPVNYENIESYLRGTEKSDHQNWNDLEGYTIIKRIRDKVTDILYQAFQNYKNAEERSVVLGLSRKFGTALFPKRYMDESHHRKNKRNKFNKNANQKKTRFEQKEVALLEDGQLSVNFYLKLQPNNKIVVTVKVHTQSGELDEQRWSKEFSDSVIFPFEITKLVIKTINGKSKKESNLKIDATRIGMHSKASAIKIINRSSVPIDIEGYILVNSEDKKYVFDLDSKVVNN